MATPTVAPPTTPPKRRSILETVEGLRERLTRRPPSNGAVSARWSMTGVILILLVTIPIAFNAITLLPEVRIPVPSLNDDAFHYLFVQRASQALSDGQAPFDMWLPTLEAGLPPFEFYQHVPHLTVVLLNRLLLGQVSLLNLFNLTRYVLLVGFPLTVYWSTRRLGFSRVAAAISAAAASLISADHRFGFEYDSYVWRGYGMYTQLWAMNLSFVVLACMGTLLDRGKGFLAAILVCSLLVLSHLLYAEMMVVNVGILALIGLNRANLRARLFRLTVVGGIVAVITSYFWVTFLHFQPYSNVSPYLESWKTDSFGARTILTWLVTGQLFDANRLPVFTLLLGLGVIAVLIARTRPALLALGIFVVWLLLYFGTHPWGSLIAVLPAHDHLLFHRFIGGVHLGGIMLIGLGGELIWRFLTEHAHISVRTGTIAAAAVLLLLFLPAFVERQDYYSFNGQWMARTEAALNSDADARTILATLQQLPEGRVYAGLRTGWGSQLAVGDIHFTDLLTFYGIPAISPPYNSMSLNSDLIWSFNEQDPTDYNLFDTRYVILPTGTTAPSFFTQPIKVTPRYTLYEMSTTGYGEYVAIQGRQGFSDQSSLFNANRSWLLGSDPAAGNYVRIDYPAPNAPLGGAANPGCKDGGSTSYQRVLPQELDLLVTCANASTFVLKVSYHPNWQVTVDGKPVEKFMVSPSYLGVSLPAGQHFVEARYQPARFQYELLVLGGLVLLATLFLGGRLSRVEKRVTRESPALSPRKEETRAGD